MFKVLGLDLGSNSIGWALIDTDNKHILGTGVRIFPEGVAKLGEGEKEQSRNASRRENRSRRRQYFRKRIRKQLLLKELSKHGFCPQNYTDSKIFNEWCRLNPYELRAKALEEELTKLEIGRVLYHMIQRRGFLSNSKSAGATDEKSKIFQGGEGKVGINETLENLGDSTLGEYLYTLYPEQNSTYSFQTERIRNRYTTRGMYIDEFERIWDQQTKYHPEMTIALKETIGGRKKDGYSRDGILFHQRPLRSQKGLIGNCTFEKNKRRAPISCIPNEYFRVYQFINNIRCNGEALLPAERDYLIKFLEKKDKVDFKEIRKRLGKESNEFKFNYLDKDKIVAFPTISKLCKKNAFSDAWFKLSDEEQEEIWHSIYFYDDIGMLQKQFEGKWKLATSNAQYLSKIYLTRDYASLSRKAIGNILPFLKDGHEYDVAVALGGVKNAFGSRWNTLGSAEHQLLFDNIPSLVRGKFDGGYMPKLKDFLKERYSFNDVQLSKLYHHSTEVSVKAIQVKLPEGPDADRELMKLRNPIVTQALLELRKVVNELIDRFGPMDRINLELGRDLKISKSRRRKIRQDNQRLEAENDRIKDFLNTCGQRHTHENILKVKLWEECRHKCPYTGKEIGTHELFSGEVQIEHIIPFSRSLDDSFLNKTICYADENRRKTNKTPYEYYGGTDAWYEFKQRVLSIFHNSPKFPNRYHKFKRFVLKEIGDLEGFVSRQLNDTRYMSREAKSYLSGICKDVRVAPGQLTSKLRYMWGLNAIIEHETDEKTREDHRHHAIDALVMAVLQTRFLMELSKWNRYERKYDLEEFPLPWEGFIQQAEASINSILVSHKGNNRVLTKRMVKTKKSGTIHRNLSIAARGELHKENVYGRRKQNDSYAYHIRKHLNEIKESTHVRKIANPAIRENIESYLKETYDIDISAKKYKVPNNAFFRRDDAGNWLPCIYMPNKHGDPVPIYKVRIKENLGNAMQLKDDVNQFVNPKNNHHLMVYKTNQGKMKASVVTRWEAVERKRLGEPIYIMPEDGQEIVSTFHINDMYLLGLPEADIDWNDINTLYHHLYKVQTAGYSGRGFAIAFRKHNDSRNDTTAKGEYKQIKGFGSGTTGWQSFHPIKVKISPSGQIIKY